jgi:hypothetical protein
MELKRTSYRANKKWLWNFGGKAPGMNRNGEEIYIAPVIHLRTSYKSLDRSRRTVGRSRRNFDPRSCYVYCNRDLQGDQKVSVHLMITSLNNWLFEDDHHRIHSECGPCYTGNGLREQFGVSINVWRLAGDTLNITCNFLNCNHRVHRNFLITLYKAMM